MEFPRYYISQVGLQYGRGYITILPYGPFKTSQEEQIYERSYHKIVVSYEVLAWKLRFQAQLLLQKL